MSKRRLLSILIVISTTFFAISCHQPLAENKKQSDILFSSNSFKTTWQQIDSLEKRGLAKDAIEKLDSMLLIAKAEGEHLQIFKILAYQSKHLQSIEEDALITIFEKYESETKSAGFPMKQIFHSALAEMYFWYYQQNRWRFSNRSQTIDYDRAKLSTWDLKSIMQQIIEHYDSSLLQPEQLQAIQINQLDEILVDPKNRFDEYELKLRPTLYDFLAHRALDFYASGEADVLFPMDTFRITERYYRAYAPSITNKRSTSTAFNPKLKTLEIYGKLMDFHYMKSNEAALLHLNLNQLEYLRNNFELLDEDSLYLSALSKLKNSAKKSKAIAELNHCLAQFYYQESIDAPSKGKKAEYRILAHKLAKENLKNFPASFGGQQSEALINQLESQHLGFQSLNAYAIKNWSLINIEHKNIPTAYLKIIESPHAALEYHENDPEATVELYNGIPPVFMDTIKLQTKKDYLEHQDLFSLPKLSQGRYIIMISNHPGFNAEKHIVSYRDLWISDLSFISRTHNNKIELRALNRTSGQALRNLKIEAWKRNYDPSKREYVFVKKESKFTDHEGLVLFEPSTNPENLIFLLSNGKDSLVSDEMYRVFNTSGKDDKKLSSTFFLDRSIYRPGQNVYFKAILVEEKDENKKVAAGIKSTVKLWDVNGRELSSQELTTNKYGSVNGFFVLPDKGLTGNYRIGNEYGQQFFSVEEYKRPTFKIAFDSIGTPYELNSIVPIAGQVISYTGIPISGAEVHYSVFRSVRYPYPYFSKRFFPTETEMIIENGIVRADSVGEFNFEFLANKNEGSNTNPDAIYNFRISVSATSENGESQSNDLELKLSDRGFYLNSDIPNQVIVDSLKEFKISALNPSGEKINQEIHLLLQKLKEPDRLVLSKAYEEAEYDLIDSIDFVQKFPLLPYASEGDMSTWPKSKTIVQKSVTSNSAITIPHLEKGVYYLKAYTLDQHHDTVLFEQYFTAYSLQENQLPAPKALEFIAVKNKAEVGDTAKFILGSSFKEAIVFWDLEVQGKIVENKKIILSQNQKTIEIPIEEILRGGFSIHLGMVKENRAFNLTRSIEVPYSNKKLNIELVKSKNEIKPGTEEEWKIKITDQQGKAANAELLVSMYDASLDQFKEHQWDFRVFDRHHPQLYWNVHSSFQKQYSINFIKERAVYFESPQHGFTYLNWFGFHLGYGRYYYGMPEMLAQDVSIQRDKNNSITKEESIATENIEVKKEKMQDPLRKNESIPLRTNFKETAFFYPILSTDDSGFCSFNFKVPDALTEWKLMAFAHNSELQYGQLQEKTISKKELMLFPNMPRFFRTGDSLVISTRILTVSEKLIQGDVEIHFMDALEDSLNMNLLVKDVPIKSFEVSKDEPAHVAWKIAIPQNVDAVRYRIVAKTEKYSDGEEKVIPVLSNKILITESLPMSVRANSTEYFQMEKLFNSKKSKSLENHRLLFEFSPNPLWFAIQALPYIMENESENSEKIFAQYFSNSLSAHIVKTHPEIRKVFNHWKSHEPDALLSPLEKNEELKSIALDESPWLMEAKNETERKRRLAILFDENRMAMEKKLAFQKLADLQLSNGGWPWFANGPDDRYITQYILAGFGELIQAGAITPTNEVKSMLKKAVEYVDQRAYEDYLDIKKQDSIGHMGNLNIHYLYTRSFFPDLEKGNKTKEVHSYYFDLIKNSWLKQSLYLKAMIAIALNRNGNSELSNSILESLRQTSIVDEDMGMYWKENQNGYYWHQSSIETQAVLIRAFEEIDPDQEAVEEMKIWLLKHKQTNSWGNSKATAQACYSIISTTHSLSFDNPKHLEIEIGDQKIELLDKEVETSGVYFKKTWDAAEIKPNMANVKIENESEGVAWGALYWQYFEDVDKVSQAGTALNIQKELFMEKMSDSGKKLLPIEKNQVKIGDRVKVRIVLEVNQKMEYVHMKDMRAAGLEPAETISTHKQQDGLYYYQNITDASTNFFFNNLPKGTYVFEYNLIANVAGDFANGITHIQCMYAPEFSSHSKSADIVIQSNK